MVAGKCDTAFWGMMTIIYHTVVLQGSQPVLGRFHVSSMDEVLQKEV